MLSPRSIAFAAVLGLALTAGARADSLEGELLKNAPKVLDHLRKQGYGTVGTLKFQVEKHQRVSDRVGPLNQNLADRLEIALVLKSKDRISIIRRPSETIGRDERLRAANFLSPDGRATLLKGTYRSWDGKPLTPDAFLTGRVKFSPDLVTMTVTVQVFGKQDRNLAEVATFTADTDLSLLAESGENFLLRDLTTDEGEIKIVKKGASSAVASKHGTDKQPLQSADRLIDFRVFYAGREAPITIDKRDESATRNEGIVAEPRPGQKVFFKLKNISKDRLGVVVMVNGENTLGRQHLPPEECTKWILDPNEEYTIEGYYFYQDEKVTLKNDFRVSSPEESKANEVNYLSDLGKITVTVFREKKGGPTLPDPDQLAQLELRKAVRRAVYPEEVPTNLEALRKQLKSEARRELLEPGAPGATILRKVPFDFIRIPIMTTTVTYYRPQRLP